ncbi:MAG: hypothetical protein AB7R00_28325 [Kofleriaceae bacterium]
MRTTVLIFSVSAAFSGCGCDDPSGNRPPPRVIPGGGIDDGAIDGVVNVYVIDDTTREPVAGATVQIGELEGTTDTQGLFVAEQLVGAQTVVVKATNYRSEMWVGANGANMTFNLEASAAPTPPAATLTGQITGFSGISVDDGHAKQALIWYSNTDDIGDPENEIATANNANFCIGMGADGCAFSVKTRTGNVALIAAIFDRNLMGTPSVLEDDTQTLIGWASAGGITVAAGVDQSGKDLTMIPGDSTVTETVDFATPPASLPDRAAIVGIDLGQDGVFQMPLFRTPEEPSIMVPSLASVSGTGYRLTAIATDDSKMPKPESIVLRRGFTGTALSAGTWIAPPGNPAVTRTGASWTPSMGATVHSVEYSQGTAKLLNITVFDGSSGVAVPELVALPAGLLIGKISAIGAAGLDTSSFSLDSDRDKLSEVAASSVQIN